MKMEEFDEECHTNVRINLLPASGQPEEVVVVLPDESCLEFDSQDTLRLRTEVKISWTKPVTMLLIEEYKLREKEFSNPCQTKSEVWRKISDSLVAQGYSDLTGEMCSNKWRSLKNTYKKVRFSQRSEAGKKRWEYYTILHEVYKNTAIGIPVQRGSYYETSSDTEPAVQIVQFAPQSMVAPPPMQGRSTSPADPLSENPTDNPATQHSRASFNSVPADYFREFVQQYKRDEEAKMKLLTQMHADYVRMEERKCLLMEKIVTKLKLK